MESFTIELCDCENVLLREIAEPQVKRKSVAMTYGLAMRSSERDRIDWKNVNAAILARWSPSGLDWIKKFAWKGPPRREASP